MICLLGDGCSRIKWAYRFSDWMIQRRIEANFDLNAIQEKALEQSIGEYKIWHQKQMLPKYVLFLRRLKKRVGERPINPDQVRIERKEMEKLIRETVLPWAKHSISLYLSLNKKQVATYKEKTEKRWKKRLKKIKESTHQKLSLERVEKIFDFMNINLKSKQKFIVKNHVEKDPFRFRVSLERRRGWSQKVIDCLNLSEEKELCLRNHFIHWDKKRTLDSEVFRKKIDELISKIINSFDDKQLTELQRKLEEWGSDFEDLSQLERGD
jgi:hypothetical protein